MALKRLILHLGMNKTGSSSIQRALFENTDILEKQGFRYLNEWGENHWVTLKLLFSPSPAKYYEKHFSGIQFEGIVQTDEERQKIIKERLDAMLGAVNSTSCETLIISGEYCQELYLDSVCLNIQNFLNCYFRSKGIEVIVVYFIRNPLAWMTSYRQEDLSYSFFSNIMQKEKELDWINNKRKMLHEAFINLKKYFAESLILLKFEDAVNDKDGLVGCFLKVIGFPQGKIADMKISKVNESRCMEVIEIINYIASKEPVLPLGENEPNNTNRYPGDLCAFVGIRGVKFDLPYQDKVELWNSLQETIRFFKSDAGIDYTDYQIPLPTEQETYGEETIQDLIEAFPKLDLVLQKLFLEFFEKKYTETSQDKFRRLYDEGSNPYLVFSLYKEAKMLWESNNRLNDEISRLYGEISGLNVNIDKLREEKDAILNSRSWRITKPLRSVMAILKRDD